MTYSSSKTSLSCFCYRSFNGSNKSTHTNESKFILRDKIRQQIICQVQKAKYYSIIFNSTPDIYHKDQTSQVLQYVKIENQEVDVVESFIDFIETKNKTSEDISDMILNKLKADNLDIMNCRGQAYDSAAVMAGKHKYIYRCAAKD
ncbi:zinc finger MYM-type protein 1-like [Prorops nasuta]|uniref:zinc finger MYM-type protein 1-like n=1 Tax=Prorops nasuta TaxID=863751 RepID=UPI0034CDC5B2